MKKVILVLILVLFVSCEHYILPLDARNYTIASEHGFVVNNRAITRIVTRFPVNVYNPNNYEITITVGSESMKINPLSSITIQTLTQSDKE